MAREPAKASAPATEPLPASLADELAAFIEYLRVERQLSPHTRSNYESHLQAMAAELVRLGVSDWARLEASQVRSLVTRMHKAGLAPAPFLPESPPCAVSATGRCARDGSPPTRPVA